MSLETLPTDASADTDVLLPWHKPEIQRLTISLDTKIGTGSTVDADGSEFLTPSDRQLKKDIGRITHALGHVLSLNGVTYRYDTGKHPEMGLSDAPQIGFIAQELEQVYPEVVKTRDDGMKAVNYAHLVPVLVEAIKEQQAMIADLQTQINRLKQ
jgi:endosialidase-like protein